MKLLKFTRLNKEFIKNLPSDILSELIVFEGVIPDGIMAPMYSLNPFFKKERNDFLNYREDILQEMYFARGKRRKLSKNKDRINVKTDENVQFIKDYPKFKQLISHIEVRYAEKLDEILEKIPIDEYLADEGRVDNKDYYNMNSGLKKLKEELDRKKQEAHLYYLDALKFEREGEYLKSQQYCRKALDLVPSNSIYEHKLKKLENRQATS